MANECNLKPWKPGQSGNLKGKPKGSKHLSTRIRDMLEDPDFQVKLTLVGRTKETFEGPAITAIIAVAIMNAIKGDDKSRAWLAKYGWPNSNNESLLSEDIHIYTHSSGTHSKNKRHAKLVRKIARA